MKGRRVRWRAASFAIRIIFFVAMLWGMGTPVFAWADETEKSVVEEILDILKANGQTTDAQYRSRLERARKEERARALKRSQTHETQPETPKTASGKERKKGGAEGSPLRAYWKNGFRLKSEDGQFSLKIGGRLHNDWAVIDVDKAVEERFDDRFGSGAEIRRARIELSGTLFEFVRFKSDFEFSGGEVALKDVFLETPRMPYAGILRVGHMKEPFSLEELTSGNQTTFMERALPSAFVPSRNTGFGLRNALLDERVTWAAGFFRETNNQGTGFDDTGRYNVSFRLTGLPWVSRDGRRLFHVGLDYTHKFMEDGKPVRFRQRPEAHLTDVRFVDTGDIPADGVDVAGFESALLWGPFSLQGEYYRAWVDAAQVDRLSFDGFYVFASYLLTGESRTYKRSGGVFGGIKPRRNLRLGKPGWGAWELAVRYSHLDLDDGPIQGGTLDDVTLGVNWYLNPNTRIMLNYIRSDLDDVGDANIFQSRFQIHF